MPATTASATATATAGRRSPSRTSPTSFNADGGIPELERVARPDPDLPDALREFLCRNPHRHGENPSWLSVALWSEEYVEGKPRPVAVEVALAELEEVAA